MAFAWLIILWIVKDKLSKILQFRTFPNLNHYKEQSGLENFLEIVPYVVIIFESVIIPFQLSITLMLLGIILPK